jgi:hypothetical protein
VGSLLTDLLAFVYQLKKVKITGNLQKRVKFIKNY